MLKSFFPVPFSARDVEHGLAQWHALAEQQAEPGSKTLMKNVAQEPLLAGLFGNSPYLSRLLLMHSEVACGFFSHSPDNVLAEQMADLQSVGLDNPKELMRSLRMAKGKLALLVALADISGAWPLSQVTGALSEFAAQALGMALQALLLASAKRGEIAFSGHVKDCGIMVLGMGKLGARELNYSSDIDIILFFEPGKLGYKGRHNEQHFMNRLAHDMVEIMQERTADGYVFRTDLRLRPDPASMPPAINVEAAYYYYESVGQNWERAAMIKARPVAGDIAAGEKFLAHLSPFMWRRNLDFASINDIHSIKRQMDSRQPRQLQLAGHNIKLGMGGIREIEFFVQIHQLIWGGREAFLRTRATCDALDRLLAQGLIDQSQHDALKSAYEFLRCLEHRLQMVDDAQTHSIPDSDEGIARIAAFMGYKSLEKFSQDVLAVLETTHRIYADSFKGAEELGDVGNLVFTGVTHDPDTLKTLSAMGFEHPETVSEIVMGWHHGSRRATRTTRARELLTELMPLLLKRLAETAHPDAAFLKFNDFLARLPSGVQLFSLFKANPHLLGLIADILGSAPTLADQLSRTPSLLDGVMYSDFYDALPTPAQLASQLASHLIHARDFEERMDRLRQFRNEKHFQAGVQLLKRLINAEQAGHFLSDLADVLIRQALNAVREEFAQTYGHIKGSRFAIIALGKLGSREMTFSSDIDLVFIYDVADFEIVSDGEKSFSPSVYYNRMVQRFLNALSAVGRGGRLYEVDTRLRPSGKQGLLAVSTRALEHYFAELAWTFEYMAFTKARVIAAEGDLDAQLNSFIRQRISAARDPEKLRRDVIEMRERIDKEFGTRNSWNIKYVRGGLMDIDFLAQYLLLLHAPNIPGAEPGNTREILTWLSEHDCIPPDLEKQLLEEEEFLSALFHLLRLCTDKEFDEETAPSGLKKLLYESVGLNDFRAVSRRLIEVEESVLAHYNSALTS